jgi:hypothetical protein
MNDETYRQLITRYGKTLKETSLDKAKAEYMTDSTVPVVDFDALKVDVCKTRKIMPGFCSCDALYACGAASYALIEFKNGDFSTDELRRKISESLLLLLSEFDLPANGLKRSFYFILVYNAKKVPARMVQSFWLKKKAGKLEDYLQLTRFRPLFFKEVYAYSSKEFEKFLRGAVHEA